MNNTTEQAAHGSMVTYTTGFVLSLACTFATYIVTNMHVHSGHLSKTAAIASVVTFAITQLFVQLIFFLHLGRESGPRWNAMLLVFAIGVVFIVVGGSVWIMDNLNYNMMKSPEEINTYMNSQGNL